MERALKAHHDKRDLMRETRSQRSPGARELHFVVQKLDDRRFHYDFRLELDGVLKSWAVSHGPSLDPLQKRLAVRTEDHPVKAAGFQGSIPKPQIATDGDGLWDIGHWRPRGDPREGLRTGILKFDLDGERLKGGFALLRLAKAAREKRENWLLVKEGDAYAEASKDGAQQPRSSLSMARNLSQISAPHADKAVSSRGEPEARLPRFVAPQLATLVASPPEGDDWLHEIKYDGYRAIAAIGGGRVRIFTRTGLDWTEKFAGIARALEKLRVKNALLDGEIVALDAQGRSSFGLLQQAIKTGEEPLTYYVFDLLELDGRDLRKEPLTQRKEILRKLLQSPPGGIAYSEHVIGHGEEIFAKSCGMGLEGVVSKRADMPYLSQRTKGWLKAKCSGNDEFVIGGYRLSNKKGRPFASLLLGEYVGKELHYRGRVGTGFDAALLHDLGERLMRLQRPTSPFVDAGREIGRDARWVEPKLVAQIAFMEKTSDGRLRHPAYLGLRGDKPAKDVQSQPVEAMPKKKSQEDDVAGVRLTHPDKVLFAEAEITKEGLAEYLVAVSERMLPHVSGRPLSLVRCPDGASKECFFQKHTMKGMPAALKSVPVEEGDGETAEYLMVDSAAGLVGAAQIGGLEIHLWGSHWKTLERPDRLVFDLDPDPEVKFPAVREAARDVRKLLDAAGLESFAMVTGGKGIHIVVPLNASQDWDEIKSFAKGVAVKLAENDPDRFVATMSKAKRKGRIFVDWLRNERGSTAIAPYSPRAKPSASVATPVSWTELSRIDAANAFTISSMLRRVKQGKTDPWKGYFSVRQSIGRKAAKFFE
jgi:bifunctional non-homologous end joining protein LigD